MIIAHYKYSYLLTYCPLPYRANVNALLMMISDFSVCYVMKPSVCYKERIHVVEQRENIQVALLSQRGRAMLRVCQ